MAVVRPKNDWKKVFGSDIKTKLKVSKSEYDMFQTTSSIIYLQQACNKLFSSVENFLMLKYNNRVRSYKQLYEMVGNNKADKKLLLEANQLHRFFYNGTLQMEVFEADSLYLIVYKKMKSRLSS